MRWNMAEHRTSKDTQSITYTMPSVHSYTMEVNPTDSVESEWMTGNTFATQANGMYMLYA